MAWRLAQVCTYIIVITRFYLYAIGIDCHKDHALGLVNVTEAAHLGSAMGACILGEVFFRGSFGLPKDPVRARFWLKKVVEGECEFKHVRADSISHAAGMLAALDAAPAE